MADFDIHPHTSGRWIVQHGNIALAVPADLGRALEPLGGQPFRESRLRSTLEGRFPADTIAALVAVFRPSRRRRRNEHRRIWLRRTLIPVVRVRSWAYRLRSLAGTRSLVLQGALGIMIYALAISLGTGRAQALSPPGLGLALVLFFGTAVWHELGHAAALAKEGYPPGRIGFGVLVFLPVLFADVTQAAALPPGGRLRVNSAGVVFQLTAGGSAMAISGWDAWPLWISDALSLAAWLALTAVTWSLIPFLRSDGFWILSDALGVEDLDEDPMSGTHRLRRVAVAGYRFFHAGFLLSLGFGIAFRLVPRAAFLLDAMSLTAEPPRWAAWPVIPSILTVLLWSLMAGRIRELATSAVSLLR